MLDDLLRRVFTKLIKSKNHFTASRGSFTELGGVLLEITEPRARLSRTEKRGKLFSSLGEFLWYLSKTNSVEFITHYLPKYISDSDDGKIIWGGYGPRLFDMRNNDQVKNVIALLRRKPSSRQAVIQLFDAGDLVGNHKDIPCTCFLQFIIRNGRLNMYTSMRSNDAFKGLPHDIFAFTMLQEIIARSLGVELGSYRHFVVSLHLYDIDLKSAHEFLNEGFQRKILMPEMPVGDPWKSIESLIAIEGKVRKGEEFDLRSFALEPFWRDLVIILQIFSHLKKKEPTEIVKLKKKLSTNVYNTYIDSRQTNLLSATNFQKSPRLPIE